MAKKKARKSSIVVFVRDRKSKDWRIVHPKRGRKKARARGKHSYKGSALEKFARIYKDSALEAQHKKKYKGRDARKEFPWKEWGSALRHGTKKSARGKRSYKGSALEAYNLARKAGKKYKGKKTRTRRRK